LKNRELHQKFWGDGGCSTRYDSFSLVAEIDVKSPHLGTILYLFHPPFTLPEIETEHLTVSVSAASPVSPSRSISQQNVSGIHSRQPNHFCIDR
jgi:hypothetical protein